jgi:hypothetical protein
MRNPSFDPGLTQKFEGRLRRVINKDGSFNVHRRGASWRDFHPYLHLINMGWPSFLLALFAGYLVANTLFAAAYYRLGPGQLLGADAPTAWGRFLNDFFFSSHTLSTVGYGNISPKGTAANVAASFEALAGVLGFAVATHPIDAESPLWGQSAADLQRLQAEVLILIKAYDDTFSQTVLARHSYRHDEIVWGRRFAPAFHVDGEGDLVLELRKVGELAS